MTVWSDRTLYDRIYDRWHEKDTDYAKVNNNRDVITHYFRSDEIVDTDEQGRLAGKAIYNGSSSWYSRMMATGFQGSLVSKNIPWIRYQMDAFELKGIDPLDQWLQDIKDHMADAYQRSNFYDVQPQFTHDGVTTGSPVLFGEEDILTQRTMWMPQHYKTVRLFYDKWNQVEGIITQDKEWTAKKIMDTFVGPDDEQGTKRRAKLSISVNNAIDQGRLKEKFVVYRATFRVSDPIWDGTGGDEPFKKPSGDWLWLSAYFLELTTAEKNKMNTPLNDNMGDFTQPFSVWNFDKKPWESSSRTPAWYAVWDCLSLQQIDKNYLENIQNANRPAMIYLDTMKNKLRLGPEGQMEVTDAEYDRPPKPVERTFAFDWQSELIEMKEEALKRWFYIDRFAMFSDLARTNKAPTPTVQIWQMAGEKATLLSPAIETHSVYLQTTDDRMIDVEARAGRGPFAPDVMANITDIVLNNMNSPIKSIAIRPVFIGQLAQAQKVSQALEPIASTMEAARPIIEIFPEARHKYRPSKIIDHVNEALDFPQDAVVPEDEWNEIVAAEREAAAQAIQTEQVIEGMKASKGIQGPVDESSVLASVGAAG